LVTRAEDAKFWDAKFRARRHTPPGPSSGSQAASAAVCESVSVVDPRAHGQESQISPSWRGIRRRPPNSDPHLCAANSMV
jgi:hypothetical protein